MQKSTAQMIIAVCLICQSLAVEDKDKATNPLNIDSVQKHNVKLLSEQLNRGWRAFCKFRTKSPNNHYDLTKINPV